MTLKNVLITLLFTQVLTSCKSYNSKDVVEKYLGIKIPESVEKIKDSANQLGVEDEEKIIKFRFSDKDLNSTIQSIKSSPFFNLNKEIISINDEIDWPKSDTVLYWKLAEYFDNSNVFGIWRKTEEGNYEIYAPNMGVWSTKAWEKEYVVSAILDVSKKELNFYLIDP
jgi:hypothetical protein